MKIIIIKLLNFIWYMEKQNLLTENFHYIILAYVYTHTHTRLSIYLHKYIYKFIISQNYTHKQQSVLISLLHKILLIFQIKKSLYVMHKILKCQFYKFMMCVIIVKNLY